METVVILIMFMVGLSFVLKLTFMSPWQMLAEVVVLALATVSTTDIAISQSKIQISEWLQTPDLMLDLAVLLTLDVALQIAFCLCMISDPIKLKGRIVKNILLFIPGLLIFPVAFYLLVQIIFSNAGMDFNNLSYSLGVAITVLIPLLVYGARYLLPEDSERFEVIFYINCIIGLLGIIATVNGRTATTGVNEVNIYSLLAIIGIAVIGSIIGLVLFRKNQNKHNNQL
ncbi:hypothetical protein [Bacteroides acidifaciens]|uniref:hypothetical protein n=1 Tax=Bacteroides acidifaciens TaxID=85831 RepID=UPI0025B49579|nr:hypothetical protein [Bacteroides acidifaciens]